MKRNIKKIILPCLMLALCFVLTSCGTPMIDSETAENIQDQTAQIMNLYNEITMMAEDHKMTINEDFKIMKEQLTEFSSKVDSSIEKATQADGEKTIAELNRIKDNLNEIKKSIEDSISGSAIKEIVE